MATMMRLKDKLDELRVLDTGLQVFGARSHRYKLAPRLSERAVSKFESQYRVVLPEDYRSFLLQMGNGGAGPFYGVFPLGMWDGPGRGFEPWTDKPYVVSDLSRDFALTDVWNLEPERLEGPDSFESDEEEDAYWKNVEEELFPERLTFGWFPISHHGCALRTYLVTSGPERGNVWFDGRPEKSPVSPHIHQGSRLTFSAWYELWLDQSISEIRGR